MEKRRKSYKEEGRDGKGQGKQKREVREGKERSIRGQRK